MKSLFFLMLLTAFLDTTTAQQQDPHQNKRADKETGHDFLLEAAPNQCTDVTYTEVATGITKSAGGATPKHVKLAPRLYNFACKCGANEVVIKNTLVGQTPGVKFTCEVPAAQSPQSKSCDINTNNAIDDHQSIGDQRLAHIRCIVPGTVTSARYLSCSFAGGEPCRSINPRDEMSGPCASEPKVACIYYQTNDGNFKVIHATVSFLPDPPPQ